MSDPAPPILPPRPRWHLPVMIGLTVLYLALGSCAVMFGMLGFMVFDAGVTRMAVIMFILGWCLPLSFFVGLGLTWAGYGFRSRWLTITGLALPFLVLLGIVGFVIVASSAGY